MTAVPRYTIAKAGVVDNRTNSGGGSGNGASALAIPDGSDDDIIAQRLRRAAEEERDPQLQKKLWKEYIQYKKYIGAEQ